MDIETIEQIRKKYPKRITRGEAIKLYCLKNCCAGDERSRRNCNFKGCFLYNFRMGVEEGEERRKKNKDNAISIQTEKNPIVEP